LIQLVFYIFKLTDRNLRNKTLKYQKIKRKIITGRSTGDGKGWIPLCLDSEK